eukprot:Opistho-2@89993
MRWRRQTAGDQLGELRSSSRTSIHSTSGTMPSFGSTNAMFPRFLPPEALSFARILLTTTPKGACEQWMRLTRGLRRVALGTLDASSRRSVARACAARLGLPPLNDAELRSITGQRYAECPLFIEALLYCRRKAPAACGVWPLPTVQSVPPFSRGESSASMFGSDSSLTPTAGESGGGSEGGPLVPKFAASAAPSLADIFDQCATSNMGGSSTPGGSQHRAMDHGKGNSSSSSSSGNLASYSGIASTLTSSHDAILCLASFAAMSTAVRANDLTTYLNVAACIASARRGISEDEAKRALGMSQEAWSTAMVAVGMHVIHGPGGRLMFSGRCLRAAALSAHDLKSMSSASSSSLVRTAVSGDIPPPVGVAAAAQHNMERRRSSLSGIPSTPLMTISVRQQLSAHLASIILHAATRSEAAEAARDLRWALAEPRPLPGGFEYVSDPSLLKALYQHSRHELLRICKAILPTEATAAAFFFNRVLAGPSARADEGAQQTAAWVLDYLGHSKLALHAYDAAIRVQEMRGYAAGGPDAVAALLSNINSLAMINEDLGEYERSAECYEKALRLLGWTVEKAYEAYGSQMSKKFENGGHAQPGAANTAIATNAGLTRVGSGVGASASNTSGLASRSANTVTPAPVPTTDLAASAHSDLALSSSMAGVRREWERVGATLSNLAAMYYILRRYPLARSTFESAYVLCEKHLGTAHALTDTARKWLFCQPWPAGNGMPLATSGSIGGQSMMSSVSAASHSGAAAEPSPLCFSLQ